MDENAFADWMKARMGAMGITQVKLREMTGITSQSAISNILTRKRRVKLDERLLIEAALGGAPEEASDPEPTVRFIPLVGLASAGIWREAIEMPMGQVPVRASKTGKHAFAVEIDGDSMNLLLPEGGYAIIDPDQTHLYDKRVYLVRNGEHEATLKRYRSNPARLEPVSDNETHETYYITGASMEVVGRVIAYGNDEGL